MTPHC